MSGMQGSCQKGVPGVWEVGAGQPREPRAGGSCAVALSTVPLSGAGGLGGKLGLPPTAELLFQFPFLGTIKYLRPW